MEELKIEQLEIYYHLTNDASISLSPITSLILPENDGPKNEWHLPSLFYLLLNGKSTDKTKASKIREELSKKDLLTCLELFRQIAELPDSEINLTYKKQFESEITLIETECLSSLSTTND